MKTTTLEVDLAVYRLDAVKKAAYRFGDRCSADVAMRGPDHAVVTLTLRPAVEIDLDLLLADFRNELLDQELRAVVAAETEAVRNVILAQAFSRSSLLDPQGETADYRQDPLGIRSGR